MDYLAMHYDLAILFCLVHAAAPLQGYNAYFMTTNDLIRVYYNPSIVYYLLAPCDPK